MMKELVNPLWNAVVNGHFEAGDATGWTLQSGSYYKRAVTEGVGTDGSFGLMVETIKEQTDSGNIMYKAASSAEFECLPGHTYLFGGEAYHLENTTCKPVIRLYCRDGEGTTNRTDMIFSDANITRKAVLRICGEDDAPYQVSCSIDGTFDIGEVYSFDNVTVYDLTEAFGAGNEPELAWCQAFIVEPGLLGVDSNLINLSGTELVAAEIEKNGFKLLWTPVVGAIGYRVYVDGELTVETAGTSAEINGLSPGTEYSCRIATLKSAGESTVSPELKVETKPEKVILPVPEGVGASETTLSITWAAVEGAAKYRVFVDGVFKLETAARTAVLSGLRAGRRHRIALSAVLSDGSETEMGEAATLYTEWARDETDFDLELITDRTEADVAALKRLLAKKWEDLSGAEKEEYLSGSHKGAYNASDLSRVGAAINFVAGKLSEAGYPYRPGLGTDWAETELFYAGDLAEYLAAVESLRERLAVRTTTPETPEKLSSVSDANDIEKIIQDVFELLENMLEGLPYSDMIFSGVYPG